MACPPSRAAPLKRRIRPMAAPAPLCPACGRPLREGARFCTSCG
ncbi:MAG: zinc ribbon domain-containing protein, partial [Dehalococcoidia bacterium]|nr:zinc ribbon domain-containing protein [Dehalococcoidia bacterium]